MSQSVVRCLLLAAFLSVCSGAQAVAFAEVSITAVRAGIEGQPLVDQGNSFVERLDADRAFEIHFGIHSWPFQLTFGQTLVYEADYEVRLGAGTRAIPYSYEDFCAPVHAGPCAPHPDVENAWAFLSIGEVDGRIANPFIDRTGFEHFTFAVSGGETLVSSGTVRVLHQLTSPFAANTADAFSVVFALQAVAAIPEPQTGALMLAGLLVAGMQVRRLRKSDGGTTSPRRVRERPAA